MSLRFLTALFCSPETFLALPPAHCPVLFFPHCPLPAPKTVLYVSGAEVYCIFRFPLGLINLIWGGEICGVLGYTLNFSGETLELFGASQRVWGASQVGVFVLMDAAWQPAGSLFPEFLHVPSPIPESILPIPSNNKCFGKQKRRTATRTFSSVSF